MWAMVGDKDNGLAVLNDCKYSYSAKDNVFSLTAIRSPIYCDHGLTRSTEANYTDQGVMEFSYALMPATINDRTRIFQRALQFNTPPTIVLENHHKGSLPLVYEGMRLDKENIVVSAFKKAEDGQGYVLRAYECDGKAVAVKIDCKGIGMYEMNFSPYEVKTVRIFDGKAEEILFTEYEE